jgi:hypothetical protein
MGLAELNALVAQLDAFLAPYQAQPFSDLHLFMDLAIGLGLITCTKPQETA